MSMSFDKLRYIHFISSKGRLTCRDCHFLLFLGYNRGCTKIRRSHMIKTFILKRSFNTALIITKEFFPLLFCFNTGKQGKTFVQISRSRLGSQSSIIIFQWEMSCDVSQRYWQLLNNVEGVQENKKCFILKCILCNIHVCRETKTKE